MLLIIMFYICVLPVIDCGDPGTPTNGQRNFSSTTYNSFVTYTCDVGYTLEGSSRRQCYSTGRWGGSVPQCSREYLDLNFVCIVCDTWE